MRTGALLLASFELETENKGSEEFPLFLPMYPLDGTTVIKREIAALRKAMLSPIAVLAGCQKDILKNHLSHNNVVFTEDREYREKNREKALQTGLEVARQWMDRVIAVPVEYPAFSAQTLQMLLQCEKSTIPVYHGQMGWPRLYVLQDNDEQEPERLPVEDPGILLSLLEKDGIARAQQYLKTQRSTNELRCKTKVILTKEEDFFGPGIYHLLKLIDENGSIQAAASKMHMSYSKAWKMVNKTEKEMGFPFLKRCNGGKSGGSSTLTEEGKLFIQRYHVMVKDMERISQNFFDIYFNDFQ